MSAKNTTKTPGYNCRLTIKFSTSKKGTKLAYYWSGDHGSRAAGVPGFGRWLRMKIAVAESAIAQDQADRYVDYSDQASPFPRKAELGNTVRTIEADLSVDDALLRSVQARWRAEKATEEAAKVSRRIIDAEARADVAQAAVEETHRQIATLELELIRRGEVEGAIH